MNKARKYTDRFFKSTRPNSRYSMRITEMFDFANEISKNNVCSTVADIFNYGYAKGYRACQSDMKNISQEG